MIEFKFFKGERELFKVRKFNQRIIKNSSVEFLNTCTVKI